MQFLLRQKAGTIRIWFPDFSIASRFFMFAPVAYAIHALEETLGFQQWVTRNFAVNFTTGSFQRNNLVFLLVSAMLAIIADRFPRPTILFLFLSWVSGLFIHNTLFHIGGTLYFQEFSPGLISSLMIYLPFYYLFVRCILRQGRLNKLMLLIAFILGGVAHYVFIVADLSGWI